MTMVIINNVDETFTGKKVRVSLFNGMYFKGLVLSEGDDWLKLRDFKDTIIFINLREIKLIEGWRG